MYGRNNICIGMNGILTMLYYKSIFDVEKYMSG